MRSKKLPRLRRIVVHHQSVNLKRQLERAAEAIDSVLLDAAIKNNPAAAPFLLIRWNRIRGLAPDDLD